MSDEPLYETATAIMLLLSNIPDRQIPAVISVATGGRYAALSRGTASQRLENADAELRSAYKSLATTAPISSDDKKYLCAKITRARIAIDPLRSAVKGEI